MQQQQKISAIDINISGVVNSKGVAWRDEGETYEQFFENVFRNEKVLGFEWNGSQLGIIIGNK